ncbi:MAG: hypothetical protein ACYSUC_02545 [Planctomycetota bacterium]|jgi:hypothetical protein
MCTTKNKKHATGILVPIHWISSTTARSPWKVWYHNNHDCRRVEGPTQIDFSLERHWAHTDQDDNIICVNRYPTLVESLLAS